MRLTVTFICILVVTLGACSSSPEPLPTPPAPVMETMGQVERLSPDFDSIAPAGAQIEKLADGFDWSEGPVWLAGEGALLFSDIPKNTVFRWKEGEGLSEFLKPSGLTQEGPENREKGSNGLLVDRNGSLILCQHGDRRIARLEADRSFTTLVDNYQGKRLNSPNDAVFKSNGDLYFTDPPYGLDGLNESPLKELGFNGVYRLTPSGELTLLTDTLTFPNGIGFSPDEKTLYVAVSDPENPVVMAFDVDDGGELSNGRVFFQAKPFSDENNPGLPDGMTIDKEGRVYASGPGGIFVLAADGTLLGRFITGVATANCGWGDDGSTLYITADSNLCRIRLNTMGLGF